MLPPLVTIRPLERQDFYDAVCSPLTSLVIATGEPRRFANLLLTTGFVKLEHGALFMRTLGVPSINLGLDMRGGAPPHSKRGVRAQPLGWVMARLRHFGASTA